MKIKIKNKGFTLVEIIISLLIIIPLTATSLAGYRHFNEQRKLNEEVRRVVTTLELAKKMALTGQKPPLTYNNSYNYDESVCGTAQANQGCGYGRFTGEYEMIFIAVENPPRMNYIMGGVGDLGNPGAVYPVDYYNKETTVIIDIINNDNCPGNYCATGYYGFTPFGGVVKSFTSITPLNSQGGFSLVLKNTVTKKTKTISVDRAGSITIQ